MVKKILMTISAVALLVLSANAASSVYWKGSYAIYDTTQRNATLMGVNGNNQQIWAVAPTNKTAGYIKVYIDGTECDRNVGYFAANTDYKFEKGASGGVSVRNNRNVSSNYSFVRVESSTVAYICWKGSGTASNLYLKDTKANISAEPEVSYKGATKVPVTVSLVGIASSAIQKVEVKRNGTVIKTYDYTVSNGFSNAPASVSFTDELAEGVTSATYDVVATPIDGLKVLVNGGTVNGSKTVTVPTPAPVEVNDVFLEKQEGNVEWGGWKAIVSWNEIPYSDVASFTIVRTIQIANAYSLKGANIGHEEEIATITDKTQTFYEDSFFADELVNAKFDITYAIRLNFTDGTSESVESSAHTDSVDSENPIHTGVNTVNSDVTAMNAFGVNGGVQVNATEPTVVNVFAVNGMKMVQKVVRDSEIINLPAGIYMVQAGKKIAKVIVK